MGLTDVYNKVHMGIVQRLLEVKEMNISREEAG